MTVLDVPPQHHLALASMVRGYLFLRSVDKMLRAQIRTVTKRMHSQTFERLTSIVGVGEAAASNVLAELFSLEGFNRPEEVISSCQTRIRTGLRSWVYGIGLAIEFGAFDRHYELWCGLNRMSQMRTKRHFAATAPISVKDE